MSTISLRCLLAACVLFTFSGARALELEDCRISAAPGQPGVKARCGTMLRPENPDDPSSPSIELRVAVVPALNLSPETDAVVPIAGGPGQGSVEFYLMVRGAFEALRRDRDILLVDQRGTGESTRMDCPIDDDAILFEIEFTIDDTVDYMKECLDKLPHDPRYFTTSVAVTDLEAVREALGYSALNLYGVSYGSRVAQHFARRYPDSTRKSLPRARSPSTRFSHVAPATSDAAHIFQTSPTPSIASSPSCAKARSRSPSRTRTRAAWRP